LIKLIPILMILACQPKMRKIEKSNCEWKPQNGVEYYVCRDTVYYVEDEE